MEITPWLLINRLNSILYLKPSCIFPEGAIIFVEYSWQSPLPWLYINLFWIGASFRNTLLISLSRKRDRRLLLYVSLFTQKKWRWLYLANFLYYGRRVFTPCQAGPNFLIIKAMKEYEMGYYEYVLIYVDDILIVRESPEKVMEILSKLYC